MRTVVLSVRLGVESDWTHEDIVNEYLRWLDDDPGDAYPMTRIVDEDTGEEIEWTEPSEDDEEE